MTKLAFPCNYICEIDTFSGNVKGRPTVTACLNDQTVKTAKTTKLWQISQLGSLWQNKIPRFLSAISSKPKSTIVEEVAYISLNNRSMRQKVDLAFGFIFQIRCNKSHQKWKHHCSATSILNK